MLILLFFLIHLGKIYDLILHLILLINLRHLHYTLFIYLYRKQIAIKDKQYLEGMIEHHSMALLTSKEILKKTDDYNIAKLAKNIIEAQENEIKIMRDLLNK